MPGFLLLVTAVISVACPTPAPILVEELRPLTDWIALSARAGRAGHALVGWLMWDPDAVAAYEALGVANGLGWIQAWRLAPLGDITPAAASAITYSIRPQFVELIVEAWRETTDAESILAVRDAAIEPGLTTIAPELSESLAGLAEPLWRGIDSVHHGARPLFAANRAMPRPSAGQSLLSAWLAANCLRELRGDNHWLLCAAADLDDVEVGLLHSAMVDVAEYGDEEWIARSRGADDKAIARGWRRLEAKGLADNAALNDEGRQFRKELESRTDELTAPAWKAIGETVARAFCEAVEPHHAAFLARVDATAGPRWMPALRHRPSAAS